MRSCTHGRIHELVVDKLKPAKKQFISNAFQNSEKQAQRFCDLPRRKRERQLRVLFSERGLDGVGPLEHVHGVM